MDNYEAYLGKNIKEARLECGYSQEKLANMCKFSSSTLSAYENHKKTPNLITTATIAKALGVSIDRLYYGKEEISFLNAAPNQGRRIVNSIYELWNQDVLSYYENYEVPSELYGNFDNEARFGVYLTIKKYSSPIKRLIKSLNEFRSIRTTYAEPDLYLEMILSSVAQEINNLIEQENMRKRTQ